MLLVHVHATLYVDMYFRTAKHSMFNVTYILGMYISFNVDSGTYIGYIPILMYLVVIFVQIPSHYICTYLHSM